MDEQRREYHIHDDDLPPEALKDCMQPPEQPILVHCIHCGEEYDSWRIVWVPFTEEQMVRNAEKGVHSSPDKFTGMWCCPIEGCDGAGFLFDIYPVDPDWVDPKTGEKVWHEDPPMIEGHDVECECVECEMLRDEEEAEMEREAAEYRRKVESGEIKPPQRPPHEPGTLTEDDIPF
jgi:hypothetical protein